LIIRKIREQQRDDDGECVVTEFLHVVKGRATM
jgi:hypothetical protein